MKILALAVIPLGLMLGGCPQGLPQGGLPGVTTQLPSGAQISTTAKKIQNVTKIACGFVPTVGTIINILASGVATPAIAIAQDICQAVTTVPLADGGPRAAKVYGVAIKGSFVK